MKLLLLFLIGVVSCSCHKEEPSEAPLGMDAALAAKAALYTSLAPSTQGQAGFITDACDALLFTALGAVGGLPNVDLRAARGPSGAWYRTPAKDCYPDRSDSSISRDMLLGVMLYAWAFKDLEMADSLYDYGEEHNWVMGQGVPSRTLMTPQLIATLAQLVYKLGGENHDIARRLPVSWSASGVSDFEAHVQVLHIILRRALYDTIEVSAQEALNAQASRQPSNPLFQWAAGNVQAATDILKAPLYWPNEQLPTTANRCSPWPLERDSDSSGWLPCPEDPKTHSGADLLFVARLIAQGI